MTKMIRKYLSYIGLTLIVFIVAFTARGNEIITLDAGNTVVLRGPIDSVSASDLVHRLLLAESSNSKAVYLVLDSGGGSIVAGSTIVEAIDTMNKPVICIAMYAASMAHAILQACNTRYITPSGVSMIHRAKGVFGGQFNDGEVESQLKFWKAFVERMEQRNANRMSLKLDEYKKLAANEFWCEGENCVKDNFVDAVANIRCSAELLQSKYTLYARGFSGVVSGCPLIRNFTKR
tara:strand:+ start:1181 stop:1882 length:702 start_codon:yes stop_codon:yes gene_type:complete